MPLESLLELVEILRERMSSHNALLGQIEMRTRYALIDPLLRGLGWDTSNPSEVVIEDGSGDGRADYLLLADKQPVMIIEAKRLGLGVRDGRQQAISYAMDPGRRARYFAVTDGNYWEIYDTHQPAINMMVISFALKEQSSAEVCLKVLALWRPSVVAGAVSSGQAPILGFEGEPQTNVSSPSSSDAQPNSTISAPPSVTRNPVTVPTRPTRSGNTEWISLSILSPEAYSKPAEIICPDSSRVSIQSWRSVPIEATRWLIKNGFLRASHCPIKSSERARRYIVAISPYHPSGNGFTAPEEVEMLNVDTHYSGTNLVKNAKTIIEYVGQDPAQFKVRLSS